MLLRKRIPLELVTTARQETVTNADLELLCDRIAQVRRVLNTTAVTLWSKDYWGRVERQLSRKLDIMRVDIER
jgi:hypothetical protein